MVEYRFSAPYSVGSSPIRCSIYSHPISSWIFVLKYLIIQILNNLILLIISLLFHFYRQTRKNSYPAQKGNRTLIVAASGLSYTIKLSEQTKDTNNSINTLCCFSLIEESNDLYCKVQEMLFLYTYPLLNNKKYTYFKIGDFGTRIQTLEMQIQYSTN